MNKKYSFIYRPSHQRKVFFIKLSHFFIKIIVKITSLFPGSSNIKLHLLRIWSLASSPCIEIFRKEYFCHNWLRIYTYTKQILMHFLRLLTNYCGLWIDRGIFYYANASTKMGSSWNVSNITMKAISIKTYMLIHSFI